MQTVSTTPNTQTRLSRDLIAGLFLIVFGAGAYLGLLDLPTRDQGNVGPGLVPKGTAALIAVLGVIIAGIGLLPSAQRLQRSTWRGPVFVLGAVVVFAMSVRTLGLAFAGPLAVIISAMADKDSRVVEVLVFAAVMSVGCIGLFKYALRLPIPLAPMLIGY